MRHRLVARREELGLSLEQLAFELEVCVRTAYRWQAGHSSPRRTQKARLAEVLRWSLAEVTLALSDEPLPPDGHAVPNWLGHYASLEQAAAKLWAFEPFVCHGLLQLAAYAVAVESVRPGPPPTPEQVARTVESRLARQAVLQLPEKPLELAVVLDESVLRRKAGTGEVMAEQLRHLVMLAERPNIDIRILTLDAGVFSAAFGSFALLTSPGARAPYMAVTEDRAGTHYLDRTPEIEAHRELAVFLGEKALPQTESVTLIRAVARELYA